MPFLYKHLWWQADPKRFNIKSVLCCLFQFYCRHFIRSVSCDFLCCCFGCSLCCCFCHYSFTLHFCFTPSVVTPLNLQFHVFYTGRFFPRSSRIRPEYKKKQNCTHNVHHLVICTRRYDSIWKMILSTCDKIGTILKHHVRTTVSTFLADAQKKTYYALTVVGVTSTFCPIYAIQQPKITYKHNAKWLH